MRPRTGEIVHYVGFSHAETTLTKHFRAKLLSVKGDVGGRVIADVAVTISDDVPPLTFHLRPMALSREEGSWHPIGGYGCDGSAGEGLSGLSPLPWD